MMDRRTFLAGTLGGAAGLSLYGQGGKSIPPPRATRLTENLFLIEGAGGNVVAWMGSEGVVLVDGGLADRTSHLMTAVSGLPGAKPVKTLYNTHWHPDH